MRAAPSADAMGPIQSSFGSFSFASSAFSRLSLTILAAPTPASFCRGGNSFMLFDNTLGRHPDEATLPSLRFLQENMNEVDAGTQLSVLVPFDGVRVHSSSERLRNGAKCHGQLF